MFGERAPEQVVVVEEPDVGLLAFIVIDDTRLGPAAGGIRTARYTSREEAEADAHRLARAMTLKCSLAGLDAGGGKIVVVDRPELNRAEAFLRLGQAVQQLGGRMRTAGDLGTTAEDLRRAASVCAWVHVDGEEVGPGGPRLALADAVGTTVALCAEIALEPSSLAGATVGVQGAGAIGTGVARAAANRGAHVALADVDETRAREVQAALGLLEPGGLFSAASFPRWEVDVLSPCARGGVIDGGNVGDVTSRALVPGANAVLKGSPEERAALELELAARGVVVVPDELSSSGAVIEGIARTVMGVDPAPLLARVGGTAADVLRAAAEDAQAPSVVARALAEARLRAPLSPISGPTPTR